jgi:hypothetical protein
VPDFGKQLLKQIRARKGREVPVILITGQYQHCVDMMTDLQEIGIDGSISKPFPSSGRTLAVVIEEVLAKHRRLRGAAKANGHDGDLKPFPGGVLAYHPSHIDLCGQTIVEQSGRGYAWQILQALRDTDSDGKPVHLGSQALMRRMKPVPEQNTLIRAVGTLRTRIAKVVRDRLGCECDQEAVIAIDDHGYHLADSILVEVYDDDGTLVGHADDIRSTVPAATAMAVAKPPLKLNEKQRRIMARLAADGQVTRRDLEQEFGISVRTAKRLLGEMSDAGLIEFDRSSHPGFYRLR